MKRLQKYLIPEAATRTTTAPSTGKVDGAAFVPFYKCRPRVAGVGVGNDSQGGQGGKLGGLERGASSRDVCY